MKTICVTHGVGFVKYEEQRKISSFIEKLRRRTGAYVSFHAWQHPGHPVPDNRGGKYFRKAKDWMDEVIMDFGYVAQNLDRLASELPSADMYVGHSAGGVIVSAQTAKPQILMGCPMQLIKNVAIKASHVDVLNVMHYRDIIATPVAVGQNAIVRWPLIRGYLNPVTAHTSYWRNSRVLDYAVEMFESRVRG